MRPGPVAVLVCVLAMFVAPTSFADPIPSQRIKVECTPQLLFEVSQRERLLQLTRKGLHRNRARKMALDELRDEDILQGLTQRAGIRISNRQVDEAYASIAEKVKLTPKNLSRALRRSGVEPETLRSRLRMSMSTAHLVAFIKDGTGGTLTKRQIARRLREKIRGLQFEWRATLEGAYRNCR